jgi:hypothetical protein
VKLFNSLCIDSVWTVHGEALNDEKTNTSIASAR